MTDSKWKCMHETENDYSKDPPDLDAAVNDESSIKHSVKNKKVASGETTVMT